MTDQFEISWETYLSSSKSVVVLYADGRGTGGRGQQWLNRVYKRLGSVEVDDTVTATRYSLNSTENIVLFFFFFLRK